ncbi:alanine dehydrogenase [Tessaracoccus antarcticus]|uniref:Alanine dehydrogenase n=1 Tax=Tessaracoccus antarcticus TaxID=2479848 RepID=A0A3M0G8B2_9ACTN|nr:alanine dehydrogenase [Tessaracoccus antarcticus]RMB61205.1 alanine dehydrogenase [Tessaracoccus antarcticus]
MRIAVPLEVKNNEFRVALTPTGVNELVRHGHEVAVQTGAGLGSSIPDSEYEKVGATILPDADATWKFGELVMKVKEPVEEEFGFLRDDLTLFTYLHLASGGECAEALLSAGTTAIAYETVQTEDGALPLLQPMSEVAGCLAPQLGAYHLTKPLGGRGVMMGGIGGVANAKVVILGAGVSGRNAANIASGMGADVTLLDTNLNKLRDASWYWNGAVQQLASNELTVWQQVKEADLVIGSVLIPGARAPKLVPNELVAEMKPGSVLVDIAIDQGGCFADSHPTTHDNPTFKVHGSTFYCVANMPGAVPHTSTYALANATLPYALLLADHGWREAMGNNPALALGLNVHAGNVVNAAVADALGKDVVVFADLS